jgi:hypothetical protein
VTFFFFVEDFRLHPTHHLTMSAPPLPSKGQAPENGAPQQQPPVNTRRTNPNGPQTPGLFRSSTHLNTRTQFEDCVLTLSASFVLCPAAGLQEACVRECSAVQGELKLPAHCAAELDTPLRCAR